MELNPTPKINQLGRATLHSRVERWECDFNDHWNVRFYGRDIQLASEAIATPNGGLSPGATNVPTRHLRFHRELFVNDPVEVRSAIVADGQYAGAIVHLLSSDKGLATSALDPAPNTPADLPEASAADLAQALPRSVPEAPIWQGDELVAWDVSAELGPIRPAECDHRGALLWEQLLRRVSLVSHRHFAQLGFTAALAKSTGVTRMTVEMRIERHGNIPAGTALRGVARLLSAGEKSFMTEYLIATPDGRPMAAIRQSLLAVNLQSRRAVPVPEFVHRALGRA